MTVVEKLKRLSEDHEKGRIDKAEFERRRAALLDDVEVAETVVRSAKEAPPRAADEALFDPGTSLILVILLSILPGLLAMLVFNLPFWTGAVIFVTCLGALTWAWARTLPEDKPEPEYPEIDLDNIEEIAV